MSRARFAILIGGFLAPVAALAQAGPIGGKVEGALPDRATSTTRVGRTKPPGAPVGDRLGTRPDLERKSRELNREIEKGICSGCR